MSADTLNSFMSGVCVSDDVLVILACVCLCVYDGVVHFARVVCLCVNLLCVRTSMRTSLFMSCVRSLTPVSSAFGHDNLYGIRGDGNGL